MKKKGGLTKGASHARGGIKMTVKSTGQQIEVEGGEGIINKHVMTSDKKVSYKGKKATPCEIASDLNQTTGNGVAFDCDETKHTDMTPTDPSTGFATGGEINNRYVRFSDFKPEYDFAKGGEVEFYNKDSIENRYRRKIWEGYKNVLGQESVGSFAHKVDNRVIGDYYLFELDGFDDNFYSHLPLKEDEILFRTETETGRISQSLPLVKVNIANGRVYFMSEDNDPYSDEDDKNPKFNKSSADVNYLSLDSKYSQYAQGGAVGGNVKPEIPLIKAISETFDSYRLSGNKSFASTTPALKISFEKTNNNEPIVAKSYFNSKYLLNVKGLKFALYGAKIEKNLFRVLIYGYFRFEGSLQSYVEQNCELLSFDFKSLKEAKEMSQIILAILKESITDYTISQSQDYLELTPTGLLLEPFKKCDKTQKLKTIYPFSKPQDIYAMALSIYSIKKEADNIVKDVIKSEENKKIEKEKLLNKEKLEGAVTVRRTLSELINLFNPLFVKGLRQTDALTITGYQDYEEIVKVVGEKSNIDKLEANLVKVADEQFPNYDIQYRYEMSVKDADNGAYGYDKEAIESLVKTKDQLLKDLKNVKKEVAVALAPVLKVVSILTEFLGEAVDGDLFQNSKALSTSLEIDELTSLLPYFDDGDVALQKKYFAELERLNLKLQDETRDIPLRDKMLKYYRDLTRDIPDYTKQKPSNIALKYGGFSQLTLSEYIQVRSQKFKNWFGEWSDRNKSNVSKVVNPETGEPLVVYHGTGGLKVPFTQFTFEKFPVNYFGENYNYADWFKKNRASVNLIYGVYLNIKNPLDFSEFSYKPLTYEDFILAFKVKYGIEIPYDDNMRKNSDLLFSKNADFLPPFWWYIRNGRTWLDALKKTRFDGLCFVENNPSDKTKGIEEITKAWCIFDANQVKLAGGLNKEFSLLKDDIRMSKGGNI